MPKTRHTRTVVSVIEFQQLERRLLEAQDTTTSLRSQLDRTIAQHLQQNAVRDATIRSQGKAIADYVQFDKGKQAACDDMVGQIHRQKRIITRQKHLIGELAGALFNAITGQTLHGEGELHLEQDPRRSGLNLGGFSEVSAGQQSQENYGG